MDEHGLCNICNDTYTTKYIEIEEDAFIFVCGHCIEKAKDNFIWLCLTCGKAYIRPKQLVISKVKDLELKRAYMLCEDIQVIQGIDVCISCSPERMFDYAEMHNAPAEC